MQPTTDTSYPRPLRDADALYRAHHRELHRAVAQVVRGPRELIEDACQTAWLTLLRAQPNEDTVFAWLRVVAIHEAYRLSAIERRDAHLKRLRSEDGDWHHVIADPRSLDDALEALEALRAFGGVARAPTDRSRAQGRRLQPRGDPSANAGTHAHQREQVTREGTRPYPTGTTTARLIATGPGVRTGAKTGARPSVGQMTLSPERSERPR
jgi:hypothetical protein